MYLFGCIRSQLWHADRCIIRDFCCCAVCRCSSRGMLAQQLWCLGLVAPRHVGLQYCMANTRPLDHQGSPCKLSQRLYNLIFTDEETEVLRNLGNICLTYYILSYFSSLRVMLCMLCRNLMGGRETVKGLFGRSRHKIVFFQGRFLFHVKQGYCV